LIIYSLAYNFRYLLPVPLEGLKDEVYDIIQEISNEADYRNGFIEFDAACEELELYW
jgi:hypothetical protein